MALAVRSPTKTWVAREGNIYISRSADLAADSAGGAGTTISGAFFSGVSYEVAAAVKTVTVTPPETGWDKQDFQGANSNSFQNQLLDEKPVGMATVTATLALAEDEMIEDMIVSGTAITAPSGYTRRQIGSAGSHTNKIDIGIELHDTGDASVVMIALNKARVTKYGDVRIAGPDGHWEQDLTTVCLAKDFYYEFKD